MDTLSSSDLDSPSKTPLFIAVAAVIVALVSLGLGWMGLSKATALQGEIKRLEALASASDGLEATVQANADSLEQLTASVNTFSKNVNKAISDVGSDMTKVRSDLRKVAIDAGTARKIAEDLEEKSAQMTLVPVATDNSASGSPTVQAPDAVPGKAGVYTIKSGDTLGKIATAYKISLSELQAANPGIDPRRLRIGQQISVPAPSN